MSLPSSPSPSPTSPSAQVPTSSPLPLPAAPLAILPPSNSRRLPPPCWSHEETLALIESYREKWYSLRRGNLRVQHWQEVADSVGRLCPHVIPSKTSVQCRHKIEKLRKRYRSEKQRVLTSSSGSSWVYFRQMDAMECGFPSVPVPPISDSSDDEAEEEYEEKNPNFRRIDRLMANGSGNKIRFRPQPWSMKGCRTKAEGDGPPVGDGFTFGSGSSGSVPRASRIGTSVRTKFEKESIDPVAEMVSSIRMLGDGFLKMEQMKLDLARETEKMRMEMELKRTQMILESQQRIIDAFKEGFSARKRTKRIISPDS